MIIRTTSRQRTDGVMKKKNQPEWMTEGRSAETCYWNGRANLSPIARARTGAPRVWGLPVTGAKEQRTWRLRSLDACTHELAQGVRGRGVETKVSQLMQDRFRRLKALQLPSPSVRSGLEWEAATPHIPAELRDRLQDGTGRLEQLLGATAKTNRYGEHLSLHCWIGEPAQLTPNIRALQLLMPDPPEEVADSEQWIFLDTETTGLTGGSGTYTFLVGLAWWEGGGLEVEQLFMRDYSEERSLLFALGERLAERRVLVTFNGKSFDWPLLETRYRMSRKIPLPCPRAHLDFLHPARNLWRLRLGSVRLSELERHVLGWDRGADLLSGLIPQIYLDFIRCGPPERLIPVSNTTRWTCAASPGSPAGFFRCSAMRKPRDKMDSNYLESPEFANCGAMPLVPGSSTKNQSRPCCRSRPTAPHGVRLRAWRNARRFRLGL